MLDADLGNLESANYCPVEGIAPIVFSCEHASNALPNGKIWPEQDRWLECTHWAWDPGAKELALALSKALSCPAVYGQYSRLLLDLNRAEDSPTLVRSNVGDHPVHLNMGLNSSERGARLAKIHAPFHKLLYSVLKKHEGAPLVSVHSFTRVYEGVEREVEVGILFDRDEAEAVRIASAVSEAGYRVALNEPYSGRDGCMFSVNHHTGELGRKGVELEVRNDICRDPKRRPSLVAAFSAGFRNAGWVP